MKRSENDNLSIEGFLKNLITSYGVILIATYFLITFVVQPFKISGMSMLPTLKDSDLIVVSKLALLSGKDFQPGDIVAFFDPAAGKNILIKRVNGKEQDSSKRYFVLGDNIGNSLDSRQFGAVAEKRIIGKAVLVIWPPADIQPLTHK